MDLQAIEKSATEELEKIGDLRSFETLYIRILGRKDGELTRILRSLGDIPADQRRSVGQEANRLREILEEKFSSKKNALEQAHLTQQIQQTDVDVTLPGVPFQRGVAHPIVQTIREMCDIFRQLGFDVAEGPDIETDFHNFGALNIPDNHPARDLHDTFYLHHKDNQGLPLLLRTHTSPVQVRLMKSVKPPVRMIAPGRVYRHEAVDATHAAVFHQIEGLAVDIDITFANLKSTLAHFAKKFFGSETTIRLRPGYFPFVEPGAEIDVLCFGCRGGKKNADGTRCSLCKATGWIELLGAGMVHPNVFRAVGYDPKKYTGFAFGMGIERVMMARAGIRDIRYFLESDLRFLEQFQ